MSEDLIYTEEFYDSIWLPYLHFCRKFVAENPKNLKSFLRATNTIQSFESLFHDAKMRDPEALAKVDWDAKIAESYQNLPFAFRYASSAKLAVSESGWPRFWTDYCLSFILWHDLHKPRVYIELGSGVGTFLHQIHARTLIDESRYFGIERSSAGVECANEVFSLLDGERDRPTCSVIQGDIQDVPEAQFDCGGLDVVIFSVSVVNKIANLLPAFYDNVRKSLLNPGKIEILHFETTGWQLYFDPELQKTYSQICPSAHGFNPAEAQRFEAQRDKNIAVKANTDFMSVVAQSHLAGKIRLRNVFCNGLSHNPIDPYTVLRLTMN
jgi:SAM-dependent methyltransferase